MYNAAGERKAFSFSVFEALDPRWSGYSNWMVRGKQCWPEPGLKKSFAQAIKEKSFGFGNWEWSGSWFCAHEQD